MNTAIERRRSARVRCAIRTLFSMLGQRALLWLGGALLCAVLAAVLAALAPVALKLLIDLLAGEDTSLPARLALPAVLLALYLGMIGLGRFAAEGRTFLFGIADQSISRTLSRHVFAHMISLPMGYHVSRSTGALLQTLENGLQGYRLLLQHVLFTILPGLIEVAVIAVILVQVFDMEFLLVFAVSTVAYLIVFVRGARRVLAASRDVSAARIDASAALADNLLNVETIKAAAAERPVTRRHDGRLAGLQAEWRKFHAARLKNGLSVAAIFALSLGTVLWLALDRVAAGAMSVGDFVLVNLYMIQLVQPLERLGFGIRDIGQAIAFLERLQALLAEKTEDVRQVMSGWPAAGAVGPASISFENVSFSYGDGRKVLDGVSFQLAPGSLTALVGPSGSGKSSIIRLLMRFHEPDQGEIRLDGRPLSDWSSKALRQLIALVPQDVTLFNESLAYNIGFPADHVPPAELSRAAGLAQLDCLVNCLPEGYETMVGERGLRLSGGEKQRVALARAMLQNPRLLLADEATSALDTETEARIAQSLGRAAFGVTSLVVAHRLSTIMSADTIIVLADGRIAECGCHQRLIRAGGLYAQMWAAQGG